MKLKVQLYTRSTILLPNIHSATPHTHIPPLFLLTQNAVLPHLISTAPAHTSLTAIIISILQLFRHGKSRLL